MRNFTISAVTYFLGKKHKIYDEFFILGSTESNVYMNSNTYMNKSIHLFIHASVKC